MRWLASSTLLGIVCLAAAFAFAPGESRADSAQESHCAMELVAGDGSAAGPVTCFETEAELNQAASLKNPAALD